jgi:hypothetical protein
MVATIFMASEGRHAHVPGLWRYLLLGQILPTSYSVALVRLAAVLQKLASSPATAATTHSPASQAAVHPIHKRTSTWSALRDVGSGAVFIGVAIAGYGAFVTFIPCALSSTQLLVQVLAARALLSSVYTLDIRNTRMVGYMAATFGAWVVWTSWEDLVRGLPEAGWAVRALIFDCVWLIPRVAVDTVGELWRELSVDPAGIRGEGGKSG